MRSSNEIKNAFKQNEKITLKQQEYAWQTISACINKKENDPMKKRILTIGLITAFIVPTGVLAATHYLGAPGTENVRNYEETIQGLDGKLTFTNYTLDEYKNNENIQKCVEKSQAFFFTNDLSVKEAQKISGSVMTKDQFGPWGENYDNIKIELENENKTKRLSSELNAKTGKLIALNYVNQNHNSKLLQQPKSDIFAYAKQLSEQFDLKTEDYTIEFDQRAEYSNDSAIRIRLINKKETGPDALVRLTNDLSNLIIEWMNF